MPIKSTNFYLSDFIIQ